MKIRTHVAMLVGAVLVPVFLFSAVVFNILLDAERTSALRSMQELARATISLMDQELTAAMATAQSLSTSPSLANGDFAAFYQQAQAAGAGTALRTALLGEDGQQIFNTVVPYGAPMAPPKAASRVRVQKLLAGNRPVYSNLISGSNTGKYVVSVEYPVTLKDGRRVVVNQWMFASRLNALLPTSNVRASWLISVFDREGITIARNHRPEQYVGKPPLAHRHRTILAGFEGVSRGMVREGYEMYGAWTRSRLSGWTVGIGVPVREIEHAAVQSVALTTLGFMLSVALALGGAILFSRRLLRSIDTATRSAELLGQREVPPAQDGNIDEMNRLQQALHHAGLLLLTSERAKLQSLDEAQQARASAEQAKAVAESQNRAKDEFLAMLGHELRNPLAAITSGVALLNTGSPDAARTGQIKAVIERQTRHLSHLVDELLDAHRILSGRVALTRRPVDLRAAVQGCLAAFDTRGASASHRVVVELEQVWIDADPTRLDQMIGNLFDNALKYTPAGGTVTVTLRAGQGQAELAIADTGIGMPPELLSRAFEVFVQGKVINRSKGGLGIGLAVVHSLAQQHDATVHAHSDGANQGSRFTLQFPAVAAPAGASQPAPARPASTGAAGVLVIEDNQDVREMMCAMLMHHGFQVWSAETGQQGIDMALACRPHVATVDIDLPDMSGHEVARRLRAGPAGSMGLIAVTGYGQPSDRQDAATHGFDFHLKKPVAIEELIALIERLAARAG